MLFICHASTSVNPMNPIRYIAEAAMAETARNNVRERHGRDTNTPAQFVLVTCDQAESSTLRF